MTNRIGKSINNKDKLASNTNKRGATIDSNKMIIIVYNNLFE